MAVALVGLSGLLLILLLIRKHSPLVNLFVIANHPALIESLALSALAANHLKRNTQESHIPIERKCSLLNAI